MATVEQLFYICSYLICDMGLLGGGGGVVYMGCASLLASINGGKGCQFPLIKSTFGFGKAITNSR